jgi:ankyrin repeat protein
VQLLLDAHAAVDAADGEGRTALHHAASNNHTAVVQLLLDAQAAVNAVNGKGSMSLHVAAHKGFATIVQLLLSAEAAVNAEDGNGYTALHWAAEEGHPVVVQLLLDANPDINAADLFGQTPVHLAAESGHVQTARLLLAAPLLTTEAMACVTAEAAAAGHTELAMLALQALMSRDMPAAAAAMASHRSLAIEVLQQWRTAQNTVRELEARSPALQQLVVDVAGTYQQLRAAAADITTSAVGAAVQVATSFFGCLKGSRP